MFFVSEIVELQEISIRQTEELHLSSIHRKGHEFERNGAFRAHIYPSFVAACSEPVSFLLKSDQSRSVSTPSLRRPERSVLFACDGQRCRSYITAEKRSDWSRSGWTHPCQCVRRKIMTSSAWAALIALDSVPYKTSLRAVLSHLRISGGTLGLFLNIFCRPAEIPHSYTAFIPLSECYKTTDRSSDHTHFLSGLFLMVSRVFKDHVKKTKE